MSPNHPVDGKILQPRCHGTATDGQNREGGARHVTRAARASPSAAEVKDFAWVRTDARDTFLSLPEDFFFLAVHLNRGPPSSARSPLLSPLILHRYSGAHLSQW